ncbi:MAG: ABC transporter ATP-binding protein [Bacillota bacterium]
MPMLEVKDLFVSYGMIEAVKGVSFHLNEGEIVTLIGSNGAGKSTILRTISGLEPAKSGSIKLLGQELTRQPAHKIVEAGVAHVPEGRRVFPRLTVQENLRLGANLITDKAFINRELEKVFEIFPRLKERSRQMAGTLSGGEQQMLALGRALMTNGKLLLLDEPSMGLAPIIVEDIFRIIKQINEAGTSILLIEQNAYLALNTASRAYVLETGIITISGDAQALLNDDRVREAYLGT